MILNQHLKTYRVQIDEIVKELHQLTIDIHHNELEKTVSDLRNRINEPFMFVIVGEVKAGKSSFINALLGTEKEICKVAPSPMTDTIQQILYGEEESTININEHLKKIFQPVDILKEIAIVDTPGTNTIVAHHQEITERFIPASDLIVFVFEAKNPYRQSAWEFFDYIHADWRKKIIFILQQKDLMNEEDLAINKKGVYDHAEKKGINSPQVFAVSAKQELERQYEESGFVDVKEYISKNITGGKAPILKLQNNIEVSKNINERIHKGVSLRKEQWEADVKFRDDIKVTLDEQETKSAKQVDILVENLVATYDRITRETATELNKGLGFFSLMRRSVSSMFSKKTSAKDWLDTLAADMEHRLNTELRDKLDDGVKDIADSIQQMGKIIDLKIRNSQTILKNNHEIFSDIAERRSNVLKDLQEAFANFLRRTESFMDEDLFPDKENISPSLAKGGIAAVVGIILSSVQGILYDVTGGILTTVGLLFAGVSLGRNRRKISKSFQQEIDKGRNQLQEEVTTKVKAYIRKIKQKIDDNFDEFDQLIQQEEKQVKKLENNQLSITNRLHAMETELNDRLNV